MRFLKFLVSVVLLGSIFSQSTVCAKCKYKDFHEDLRVECGLSEVQLNNALKYELAGKASLFLEAEEKYNVNAIFLAAVAALESGWGQQTNEYNNYFGWLGGPVYENPDDSILEIAEKISSMYLNEEGIYFEGYGVMDFHAYCEGNEWGESIISLMNQIYEDAISLTIPE